jgi:hypothetical protein
MAELDKKRAEPERPFYIDLSAWTNCGSDVF